MSNTRIYTRLTPVTINVSTVNAFLQTKAIACDIMPLRDQMRDIKFVTGHYSLCTLNRIWLDGIAGLVRCSITISRSYIQT